MSKWFWIILGLAVVLLIGVFALFNNSDQSSSVIVENTDQIVEDDHTKGPASAPVTLIEYADFQCPACKAAFPLVQQLQRDYPNDLQLVFRHFPLTSIHPNAFAAARAAEAAGAQGKFFEMHDLLYENQDEWSSSPTANNLFKDYAAELGLDTEKFNDDFGSGNITDRINRDVKIGQNFEVSATPTFYLNGEKVESNLRSYEEFKKLVESALAQ